MNFLTSWLLSVIGTALLVALAEALIPDTKVREAGRLVGGLLLLVALLGPLIHLRGAELDFSVSEHLAETAQKEEEYRNAQNDTFSLLIKERCEAYIEAAAQEMGLEVHTRVALQESEEGIPQPSEVWLDIPYHASLSAQITQELGIAEQYQSWGTKNHFGQKDTAAGKTDGVDLKIPLRAADSGSGDFTDADAFIRR